MATNSHWEPDARVYDLRKVSDEHKPLPPTSSAQLLKPRPDTEAPKSLVEKIREGFLRLVTPKN